MSNHHESSHPQTFRMKSESVGLVWTVPDVVEYSWYKRTNVGQHCQKNSLADSFLLWFKQFLINFSTKNEQTFNHNIQKNISLHVDDDGLSPQRNKQARFQHRKTRTWTKRVFVQVSLRFLCFILCHCVNKSFELRLNRCHWADILILLWCFPKATQIFQAV